MADLIDKDISTSAEKMRRGTYDGKPKKLALGLIFLRGVSAAVERAKQKDVGIFWGDRRSLSHL